VGYINWLIDCCYDLSYHLNPLLGQSNEGRTFWSHAMDWNHTTLNSGFRFRIKMSLGVRASDASDTLIVGYLLELF
jgi:hypothetical protein